MRTVITTRTIVRVAPMCNYKHLYTNRASKGTKASQHVRLWLEARVIARSEELWSFMRLRLEASRYRASGPRKPLGFPAKRQP
jgi:hypothetical protein